MQLQVELIGGGGEGGGAGEGPTPHHKVWKVSGFPGPIVAGVRLDPYAVSCHQMYEIMHAYLADEAKRGLEQLRQAQQDAIQQRGGKRAERLIAKTRMHATCTIRSIAFEGAVIPVSDPSPLMSVLGKEGVTLQGGSGSGGGGEKAGRANIAMTMTFDQRQETVISAGAVASVACAVL